MCCQMALMSDSKTRTDSGLGVGPKLPTPILHDSSLPSSTTQNSGWLRERECCNKNCLFFVLKCLGIPIEKRGDAITSMVYEAKIQRDDPIYGYARAIFLLKKQILHVELQLAAIKAELLNS